MSRDAGYETTGIDAAAPERRSGCDRRQVSARSFVQGGLTPRRRTVRRAGEAQSFVDWHEPHLLFLALTILLLSVTDAFLTVILLTQGAHEANPFLAFLLERYPGAFAGVKMVLTGAGVLVLVAMARASLFRIIRVTTIMHWCLIAYVALIAYEWWLLRNVY